VWARRASPGRRGSSQLLFCGRVGWAGSVAAKPHCTPQPWWTSAWETEAQRVSCISTRQANSCWASILRTRSQRAPHHGPTAGCCCWTPCHSGTCYNKDGCLARRPFTGYMHCMVMALCRLARLLIATTAFVRDAGRQECTQNACWHFPTQNRYCIPSVCQEL